MLVNNADEWELKLSSNLSGFAQSDHFEVIKRESPLVTALYYSMFEGEFISKDKVHLVAQTRFSLDALICPLRDLKEAKILNIKNFYRLYRCKNLPEIGTILSDLQIASILTQANFDKVFELKESYHSCIGTLFHIFQSARALSQDTFDSVTSSFFLQSITEMICLLQQNGLGSPDNFKKVLNSHHIDDLSKALLKLEQNGLINQTLFDRITDHKDPLSMAFGIIHLSDANILNKENLDPLQTHTLPTAIGRLFLILQRYGIFTESNKQYVLAHPCPDDLGDAIVRMAKKGIPIGMFSVLNGEEYMRRFYSHLSISVSKELKEMIDMLYKKRILTLENVYTVIRHKFPLECAKALLHLHDEGVSAQQYRKMIACKRQPYEFIKSLLNLQQTLQI